MQHKAEGIIGPHLHVSGLSCVRIATRASHGWPASRTCKPFRAHDTLAMGTSSVAVLIFLIFSERRIPNRRPNRPVSRSHRQRTHRIVSGQAAGLYLRHPRLQHSLEESLHLRRLARFLSSSTQSLQRGENGQTHGLHLRIVVP